VYVKSRRTGDKVSEYILLPRFTLFCR